MNRVETNLSYHTRFLEPLIEFKKTAYHKYEEQQHKFIELF
jgi:hypothetical protein